MEVTVVAKGGGEGVGGEVVEDVSNGLAVAAGGGGSGELLAPNDWEG